MKDVPEDRVMLSVGQYSRTSGINFPVVKSRLYRDKAKWWFPGLRWVKVNYKGKPQMQMRIPRWARPMPTKLVALARWIAEGKTIKELRLLLRPPGRKSPLSHDATWREIKKLDDMVKAMTKLGAKWPVRLPKEGYEWPISGKS